MYTSPDPRTRRAINRQIRRLGKLTIFNPFNSREKEVRVSPSNIHGLGLFSNEPIMENDMIVEYKGERISNGEADIREKRYLDQSISDIYLFRIDRHSLLDATEAVHVARFINHSCKPNSKARIMKASGNKHIVIYALRDLAQGKSLRHSSSYTTI